MMQFTYNKLTPVLFFVRFPYDVLKYPILNPFMVKFSSPLSTAKWKLY